MLLLSEFILGVMLMILTGYEAQSTMLADGNQCYADKGENYEI